MFSWISYWWLIIYNLIFLYFKDHFLKLCLQCLTLHNCILNFDVWTSKMICIDHQIMLSDLLNSCKFLLLCFCNKVRLHQYQLRCLCTGKSEGHNPHWCNKNIWLIMKLEYVVITFKLKVSHWSCENRIINVLLICLKIIYHIITLT